MKSIRNLRTVAFESGQKIAVVILHGYGANCHNLVPIRESITDRDHFDWYYPDGPLDLGIGQAWFPIRIGGAEVHFIPQGLEQATEQIKGFLEELHRDRVYLGGFSQGAVVATNLAMQWPQLVHKLFILSGTMINGSNWQQWVANMREIPTLQSHGRQDMILPFAKAEALNQLFRAKPDHAFHPFSGGHEIPPSILQSLSRFLYA